MAPQSTEAVSPERAALKIVGRLAVVYCAFALASQFFGPLYGNAVLPVVKTGLELAHPQFSVRSASIHDGIVRLVLSVEDRAPRPHEPVAVTNAAVTIPLSQLLVCPIVMLTLLVGWPRKSLEGRLTALAFAVPLVALVAALDTSNAVAAILAEKLAGRDPKDVLAFWWFCLDNGGRQFLAILAALAAALGARFWLGRASRASNQPSHDAAPGAQRPPRLRLLEIPTGSQVPVGTARLPVVAGGFRMRLLVPAAATTAPLLTLRPSAPVYWLSSFQTYTANRDDAGATRPRVQVRAPNPSPWTSPAASQLRDGGSHRRGSTRWIGRAGASGEDRPRSVGKAAVYRDHAGLMVAAVA